MLKPGGYSVITSPDGVKEWDTFTCFHCNSKVNVPLKADPSEMGGLCKNCMKLICPKCLDKGCYPFEKKLERAENRDRFLRSL